jgi:7-carboxy-7-deazaguanine synthase
MTKPLLISEIYGPVVQGEGLLMGTPTIFIRLGGCDYRCSWCDSLYAVLPKFLPTWERLTPQEIIDQLTLLNTHVKHVTLSGGNPAIHNLTLLLDLLADAGYDTAIETQGTIYQTWLWRVGTVTVSPKPPSSGNVTEPTSDTLARIVNIVDHKGPPSSLKVVVFNDEDYAYAKQIHTQFPRTPLTLQVGTDQTTPQRALKQGELPDEWVAYQILESLRVLQEKTLVDPDMVNVKVLPQLHSILYGLKRGI